MTNEARPDALHADASQWRDNMIPFEYGRLQFSRAIYICAHIPPTADALLTGKFELSNFGEHMNRFLDSMYDGVEHETSGIENGLRLALGSAKCTRSARSFVDVYLRLHAFAPPPTDGILPFSYHTGDDVASARFRLNPCQTSAGFGDAADHLAYLLATAHLRDELNSVLRAMLLSQTCLAVADASYRYSEHTLQPSEARQMTASPLRQSSFLA